MTKITFVGAGSMVFATKIVGGILSFDELDDSKVSLMNIGEYRPKQTTRVAAESRRGKGTAASITLSGPVEIDEIYVLPEKSRKRDQESHSRGHIHA